MGPLQTGTTKTPSKSGNISDDSVKRKILAAGKRAKHTITTIGTDVSVI